MSRSAEVVVACCQLAPRVGEPAANRAAAEEAVAAAADAGARVVVLPELAVSGYVFADADEARGLAEPLDGPTIAGWARLARARELVIVGGLCERDDEGVLRNSAVLVDASGVRAVYRKAHLWDREARVFAPGSAAPPVVDTALGRIGMVVCYDLEFPEWVRLAALAGAELLCAPVNWPAFPRPDGERAAEVVRVQAAAAVNRMFVAACDRTGLERGVDWLGGSVIVDPDGFPVAGPADAGRSGLITAACRLADARDKRLGEANDVVGDRRPGLYATLAEEAEILAAVDALVSDFGAGRVVEYFGRLAPDASFVFHTTPGRLESRAAYRAVWDGWVAEEDFRVLACASSNRRVQRLAPDAAVVAHDVATRVSTRAGDEELCERETIVLERRDGAWLVVHEHLSAG